MAFTGVLLDSLDGAPTMRICTADATTGDLRVVSFGPNLDMSPTFSADGRTLAFRSDRSMSGNFQVYFLDLQNGETRAAPQISGGWVETCEFSPDGGRLLMLVAAHGADVAGAQGAKTSQRLDARGTPHWLPTVETSDPSIGRRSAWVLDLSNRSLECVSPPDLNVWETAWSGPRAIAAVVSTGGSEDEWYHASLVRIDLRNKEAKTLYTPKNQLGALSGSPDGRRVAFVESVCSDRGLCAGTLRIVNASGDQSRPVETQGVDVTFTSWRNSSRLLIAGIRHLESVVAEVDETIGQFSEHWASEELSSMSPFYPRAVSLGPKGFAAIVQGHRQPAHIVRGTGGGTHTIANLDHSDTNWAMKHLRPVQPYRWKAPDGQEIEGWLMPGAKSGPCPLIMEMHGGPIWRWSPFFLGRTGYHCMLAEQGYAFFWPNPRGSSGRGQDFARAALGDLGGADTKDCLSGLDSLVADRFADPTRIGIMGGSYGGFLTAWLVTQDSRFAAAIAVAPATDWVSQHLTSNIPYFDTFSLRGSYADAAGQYFTRSPIMFGHRAKTPTLNICGALDRCTPPGQAREFHNALIRHGVNSALITYPMEGHGVQTFPAMIDYAARIVDWFTRWMPPNFT